MTRVPVNPNAECAPGFSTAARVRVRHESVPGPLAALLKQGSQKEPP